MRKYASKWVTKVRMGQFKTSNSRYATLTNKTISFSTQNSLWQTKQYHSQRKIQRGSHCILKDTARSQSTVVSCSSKIRSFSRYIIGPIIFPTFTHVLHSIHTKRVATLRWYRGDTASRSLFIIVIFYILKNETTVHEMGVVVWGLVFLPAWLTPEIFVVLEHPRLSLKLAGLTTERESIKGSSGHLTNKLRSKLAQNIRTLRLGCVPIFLFL